MSARWIALALGALTLFSAALAEAEPIMKPRKYHGPIPQSMVWLRAGMFGGASNEEMNTYLDGRVQDPFTSTSEDFGTSLAVEFGYAHKPHPQFAVRLNASLSFLSSPGSGNGVAQVPGVPDTIPLPVVDFTREFESKLIVIEASGVYFFSDAAVQEFQTYIGAGFSFGIPYESFTETQVDSDTGEVYYASESSEWGFSPGVHAVLGLLYYIDHQFAITAEGRLQQMKGRYEQLQAVNEVGDLENVNFEVDYAGFYLTVGMAWGF
jgi:hypothetical protein